MYRVIAYNGATQTEIHNELVNDLKLETGVIKTSINSVDSFEFKMYLNNVGYGKMSPFKTLIKVLNTKTGRYDFEGRVLTPTENMESNGLHSKSYVCEGELGYLHDSQQRHLEFRGTPSDLLNTILSYHNNQVEEYKHFQLGNVTVTNSTNNVYVYLSGEQSTFETIKDKLLSRLGGELQIRKVGEVRYLDYIVRVGSDKDTEIRLAKNLVSMTRDIDPSEIITRLTPLGSRIASEDETATDASEARLTIESVNSGLPYIDRPDLISVFGIQGGSETWDDIHTESILLSTATKFINNQKVSLNQYKVTALDLSIIGLDIDEFRVGDSYKVINPIMAIDERLRIIGTSKDINAPQDGTLTIGDKFKSLYEYQEDTLKSNQAISDLQDRLDRVAQINGSLNDKLIQAQADLTAIKNSLTDIDVDNLPTELVAITQAIIGLQDDINNIVIPTYTPVTTTKDGLMTSTDKVKLNGLENYTVATETVNGLMSFEDKKAHNNLVVDVGDLLLLETLDKTDLVNAINELVTRIETLESGEPSE